MTIPPESELPRHPEIRRILLLIFGSFLLSATVVYLTSRYARSLQMVAGEFFLVLPSLLYLRAKTYDSRTVLRLWPVNFKVLAASAVMAVAAPFLLDEFDRIVQTFIEMPAEYEAMLLEMFRAQTLFDWVMLFLGTVLLAAIVEEILFRGMLQQALERKFDPPFAIFISAMIFAMIHPSPWLLQVLVIGLLFGYCAWRSGSIMPGLVIHAFNNAFALFFTNIDSEQLSWYNWNGHVHPTIVAVAACLTFYGLKWFNDLTKPRKS